MAIRVDVYTSGGMASGILARAGHAPRGPRRPIAELPLDGAAWQALDDAVAAAGRIAGHRRRDDILVAVADEDPSGPIHAAWHHVQLDAGPYAARGRARHDARLRPGPRR